MPQRPRARCPFSADIQSHHPRTTATKPQRPPPYAQPSANTTPTNLRPPGAAPPRHDQTMRQLLLRSKQKSLGRVRTLMQGNATSHVDRHGHGYRPSRGCSWRRRPDGRPSAVRHELLNSKHKSSNVAAIGRTAACGQQGPRKCALEYPRDLECSSPLADRSGLASRQKREVKRCFREHTFSEVNSGGGYRERASSRIAGPGIRFREHERSFWTPPRTCSGRPARCPSSDAR